MKVNSIIVRQTGGPEVLEFTQQEIGEPGPGQALVRNRAIGLNFAEIYVRAGRNPPPALPFTPGIEGAGVVEAVGPGVTEVKVGDRVAYAGAPMGSYTEARLMPSRALVKLPDGVSEETAAAAMLKGLTAQYLIHSTYAVKPGDTILIHAAAGGVGLIVCQWAKHLGATVIGTVSTAEKARLAAAHGCDYPINYTTEDFVARVKEITKGEMLPVVYDSVGQTTFMKSLDCLRPLGLLASFGQASGPIPPFDVSILGAKGSLYLTRQGLATYTAKREELEKRSKMLFDVLASGAVKCEVRRRFALKDAAQAHRALGERETVGSSLLMP
jgi:NADPH2:quinone reductase